jgi:hypothetical protein
VSDTADAPAGTRRPRTVDLAFVATIVTVALTVISAALWWGYQGYLRNEFYNSNNKLKTTDKNKKTDYDIHTPTGLKNISHDVHNWLVSGLVQSVLFGLALVLIAVNVRRGKGWARWLLLILFAIPVLPTAAPYRLLAVGGNSPGLMRVVSVLIGLAGLAVIVLLIMPESSRYFAAVRAEQQGERSTGAARPGLRDLFSARVPPDAARASKRASARPAKPETPPLPQKSAPVRPAPPPEQPAAAPSTPAPSASTETRDGPAAKSKTRSGTETSRPATSVAAKSRGKSRRGS